MNDTQLMERYVAGHDPSAFRDLVARHGPAVLRACRRFLHDPHEAEDAMQATFLVLVQRAPSIRDPEHLDRWLAGVARRVAARARRRTLRRAERERNWAAGRPEADPDADGPLGVEARRLVREELGHLPDADRTPLTLCYLDGLTHEEAARRIGCPVGTVKARLVRARRRLRDRLDRRGMALGLALLLLLLRRPRPAVADDAALDAAAESMGWLAAGDVEAVEACWPRAWDLARAVAARPILARRRPLLVLALLLIGVAVVGGGIARAAADRAELRRASAGLAKLLTANCRVGPEAPATEAPRGAP